MSFKPLRSQFIKNYPNAPLVTTQAVSSITDTTATGNGTVVSDEGSADTERGVYYSLTSDPMFSGTKVSSGSGIGAYTVALSGLSASTTYYVQAYATNAFGTGFGSVVSFATSASVAGVYIFSHQMMGMGL